MNDAVDRILLERQALDQGFPGSLALSAFGHLVIVTGAFLAVLLGPKQPPLAPPDQIMGFAAPHGGGGTPEVEAPAPSPVEQPAEPDPPAKAEPPAVLKPPKPEASVKKGLPEMDVKKNKKKPEKAPSPRPARTAGTPGGTGGAPVTLGISGAPPGPGTPDGTEAFGDWYLASVQQKIWMIWTQQIKPGFAQPIYVTFTIEADGNVSDVRVTQRSGASLLDFAAQRAVQSAAPFGPLPKHYGTNRFTIQAIFKPTP